MLPQRAWRNSAVGEPELKLYGERAGEANADMKALLPWWLDDTEFREGLGVPVVGLDAVTLKPWARTMTAQGSASVPAVLMPRGGVGGRGSPGRRRCRQRGREGCTLPRHGVARGLRPGRVPVRARSADRAGDAAGAANDAALDRHGRTRRVLRRRFAGAGAGRWPSSGRGCVPAGDRRARGVDEVAAVQRRGAHQRAASVRWPLPGERSGGWEGFRCVLPHPGRGPADDRVELAVCELVEDGVKGRGRAAGRRPSRPRTRKPSSKRKTRSAGSSSCPTCVPTKRSSSLSATRSAAACTSIRNSGWAATMCSLATPSRHAR